MRWMVICAVWGLVGCAASPDANLAPTGPFSKLVVFGDSVSDNGNLAALTAGTLTGPPYYPGRFCNGPNWVDRLAERLGVDVQPSVLGGTNYAFGAATTGHGLARWEGTPVGPNLLEQIQLYRDQPRGSELFAVWCGAADAVNTIAGQCTATAEGVADHIAAAITTLYDRGGRFFLVVNLPDFGLMPRYRAEDVRPALTDLCSAINTAVAARLDQIDQRPGITVFRLDAATTLADMVKSPPEGVTNVTDPAWSGTFFGYLGGGGELADNPDAYLFWDNLHPAGVWHEEVAEQAMALFAGQIPAPESNTAPLDLQPLRLPPFIDYQLTYLMLVTQSGGAPGECRF